jgi:ribosomal protein L11 methyltransferase
LVLHKSDYTDARIPYQDLYIYYLEGRLQREDEPRFGPHFLGNWIEEGSSFLFFSRPTRGLVQDVVDTNKGLRLVDEFYFTYEEWQGGKIKPFTVSPFFVVPPWEDSEDHHRGIKILLDPGVVFGTTLHPTTRGCLSALATVCEQYQIDRVLDLGTGTGILAVGAALLGAKSVVAIDINPLAVKTALSNVRLNGLEEKIEVKEGLAEKWSDHLCDLIIANIHYDVIIELIKGRGFLRKKWFIFSGLMRSQAESIKSTLSEYPTEIVQEWNHEMVWHTFLGKVKGSSNE